MEAHDVQRQPQLGRRLVCAEQVHGASIASIESEQAPAAPVAGCDALLTQVPGLTLAIRTADCVPVFLWDPIQAVAGVAHAGWRGLAQHLPMRLVGAACRRYHSRREDLWVGIGPAIRACCYEVQDDFPAVFAPFLNRADGRTMCDLVGYARAELRAAGVRPSRIVDTQQCTGCDAARWHSVRANGQAAGRVWSLIMIQP